MAYQPFLIAPFGTGLDTDLSPWQLPQDAFSDIINGHIRHGVIEKRSGFIKQGDIVHKNDTNWDITSITQASPCVVTLTDATGFTANDVVEFRNVTGMTELNGNQYVISAVTAGAAGTITLQNVNSTTFTAYIGGSGGAYLVPQNRVMGIYNYIDSSNAKEVIAFNTQRASKYNPTNKQYNPVDSAAIMNGGDEDYIWTENWASTASSIASTLYRLYFTNGLALSSGLNGIRYYDGGSTTLPFNPTINGGPIINGCKLIFAIKQRLVLLHTIEGANTYPQRARWCQAQKPGNSGDFDDEWDDDIAGKGGYVDAPTGDHIISAQFVQDIIIVMFTNSVWTLRPTADPALPFRWDKINDFRSCDGKMTSEKFDRYIVAAGVRGITATDGVETRRFDDKIEDFVGNEINNSKFAKTFAKRDFENRRLWMLYPSKKSDDADAALIYDEESSAFSKYKIDMNVLGYGGAAEDAAIDDFGGEELQEFNDDILTDYFLGEASEIFLGGNTEGRVFILDRGGDDQENVFSETITNVTQANPGVVTMTGAIGLSDGDIISISDIAAGSMVELNDAKYTVTSKSGNTFALQGVDSSGFTAYVAGSAGTIETVTSNSIEFTLESAAWNPWMTEGAQSQLGYIDLFLDTHKSTDLSVSFFCNNDFNPYKTSKMNLLPDLVERGPVSNITNANPGQVTSNCHGLVDNATIYLYGIRGMESVNGGPYTVTVIDGNNFTIGIDTTDFAQWTNCGVITELPYASTKAWKRIYAGGTGYQHKISISSEGKDRPVRIHAFMPWFKKRGRTI